MVSQFPSLGEETRKLFRKTGNPGGNYMETMSFKALSILRLQGNHQGNRRETMGLFKETLIHKTDIISPDELMGADPPLIDSKTLSTYCLAGDCWCSCRIPRFTHECRNCDKELATNWRPEPKACLTDDELQAREQCRFWNQVCHAVGMYQDQCTETGDSHCRVYRFLDLNTEQQRKAREKSHEQHNCSDTI